VNFDFTASFNDPDASKLWAFQAKNGLDVIGAYDALPSASPKQVIVAVVDTGVDHNHEDLKDIMWSNEKEIKGNGIDDDNNGYIDDIHGINVLERDEQGRATMNTMASHWHGTHVSGTIAAEQNNGIGIAGVANNVKIMAIRTVPDDSDELDSNIVEAYLYAAKMGARIINCSFGKAVNEGGMVVRDTINQIAKKNVLVVISAGNDSMGPMSWHDIDTSPKYPASFDSANTLVIASTTSAGDLSSFSNVGARGVDVASPGSNIYSTINGNKYSMASGTSMAAPNASGVAAMVLGHFPNLKTASLKKVLMDSVTKVPAFKGKMVTEGRLNLKAALTAAKKAR
jgi:subtilisin family serine protease